MKQYHEHLEAILKYGTKKDPAREGMPGSLSLFGYQNRYNLQEGFPILTTKKINFKNIVVELLWFLRGDTNIKYLVDNGCNIWNEDAYNYFSRNKKTDKLSFGEFVDEIKLSNNKDLINKGKLWSNNSDYILGDCGKQYGWLWRNWENIKVQKNVSFDTQMRQWRDNIYNKPIDQIKNLIEGLKSNPEGRRHIITAWNPATLDDMALNACHSFVQFNCRKLSFTDKCGLLSNHPLYKNDITTDNERNILILFEDFNIPNYYLDCQLYQRSADMFLGVPYNISSYALLTEIIAKICNMIPGDFIHTFGDSHIYDNHLDQVKELLNRDTEKYQLSKLKMDTTDWNELFKDELKFKYLRTEDFQLENYESYPTIKGKLSTGLK